MTGRMRPFLLEVSLSRYKITNVASGPVKVPGPTGVVLKAGESLIFKTSAFSLTMAESSKLLSVEKIVVGKPVALPVKSGEDSTKSKKSRRSTKDMVKPAKNLQAPERVKNDG